MYILLIAGAVALYLPHAGIPFCADDFEFRFDNPKPYILGAFGHVPLHRFRPIKASWCALNQYLFGEDTFVLQASHVAMHAALTAMLLWFLRKRGVPLLPSFLAATWFLVNPINTAAILGGNTTDQVGSAAAGFLSFALAWEFGEEVRQSPSGRAPLRLAIGSLIALAIALLFKENGLGFVGIDILILGFQMWRIRSRPVPGANRKLLMFVAMIVVMTGAYFIYRNWARDADAPIQLGTGVYDFKIGKNILVNQIELLGGALLPFSTADAYVAAVRHSTWVLAAMGAGLLAWLALLAAGLTIAKQWRTAIGLGILAVCASVPVVFLNHVSELYAYSLAPFLAMIFALAMTGLWEARRSPRVRILTVTCLLGVLVSSVVAVNHKSLQMAVQGHKSVVLLPQVVNFARQLPPGGKMLLWERQEPGALHYSKFFVGSFESIDWAGGWIKHLANRPDIEVKYVAGNELEPADLILVPDTTGGSLRARVLTTPVAP